MMSDIQTDCMTPERTVIGHPFNPPYLLPLVEIVGGKKTAPEAVTWAGNFIKLLGKHPCDEERNSRLCCHPLQEAFGAKHLHMVANGEATPEDIDIALMNGPAPRMAAQGQCMAFHVACGEGGMATNLRSIWSCPEAAMDPFGGTGADPGTPRPNGKWLQCRRWR